MDLNQQNAAQILQSPSVFLLQVGAPGDAVTKKLNSLREAAQGRLPLVRLDCAVLPQICQALQISSSPTVLLMSRGQVSAALENDLSPTAVTGFVERVAQMLGVKVELSSTVTEQLEEAEEAEWSDARAAGTLFQQLSAQPDMQVDAQVRAAAGQVRCALRLQSEKEEAKKLLVNLQNGGHGRVLEVKQAASVLWLDENRPPGDASLEKLQAAAEASPAELEAVQPYAIALFWAGREGDAVDAGLALLRKKRSEEVRQLVLNLVEALGPRHPRSAASRRAFSAALFV